MTHDPNPTARDLMLHQPIGWNLSLIFELFDSLTTRDILSIHLTEVVGNDRLIWAPDANGEHIVKFLCLSDQEVRFSHDSNGFGFSEQFEPSRCMKDSPLEDRKRMSPLVGQTGNTMSSLSSWNRWSSILIH